MLAYLPMAWVGDHIFSIGQSYVAGFCVSLPGEPGNLADRTCKEIGPTYFFAPPRIFENILTTVNDPDGGCRASLKRRDVPRYFMDRSPNVSASRSSTARR